MLSSLSLRRRVVSRTLTSHPLSYLPAYKPGYVPIPLPTYPPTYMYSPTHLGAMSSVRWRTSSHLAAASSTFVRTAQAILITCLLAYLLTCLLTCICLLTCSLTCLLAHFLAYYVHVFVCCLLAYFMLTYHLLTCLLQVRAWASSSPRSMRFQRPGPIWRCNSRCHVSCTTCRCPCTCRYADLHVCTSMSSPSRVSEHTYIHTYMYIHTGAPRCRRPHARASAVRLARLQICTRLADTA